MFEEGQLYAPVTEQDGEVTVHLAPNHPGIDDAEYRQRRNAIAAAALGWQLGMPLPVIEYTDAEHEVWRVVTAELRAKHQRLAPRDVIEAGERLGLPDDHIPQLSEVNDLLATHSDFPGSQGFQYQPVCWSGAVGRVLRHAGRSPVLVDAYIRHASKPLYTPEPDVVHEVVGHATTLASPRLAALYEAAGHAARRCETPDALEFVSRVFWFSLEFGVLRSPENRRLYGAGLLSSYGEIEEFVTPTFHRWRSPRWARRSTTSRITSRSSSAATP